jgi:hypothetical protein
VVVGVTGHQNLPAAAVTYVRGELVSRLTPVDDLEGVCSLAAGADQLFADIVLDCGGKLQVVIPSHGYEGTFQTDTDRSRYLRLLRAASERICLNYSKPSEDAFFAAGRAVVDMCDYLIAVWDGEKARGHGGTADIVAYAGRKQKRIEIIWPEGITRD